MGAFQLSDRVINGHITLVKNPYYWDAGHVRLSKVNYIVVSDYDAATDQYLAGEMDFTDRFNVTEKERLQRHAGRPSGDLAHISRRRCSVTTSQNLRSRTIPSCGWRSISHLDRDILVKYVAHGVGVPAYNIMPPLAGYRPGDSRLGEDSPTMRGTPWLASSITKQAIPTAILWKRCSPMRAADLMCAGTWKRSRPCGR